MRISPFDYNAMISIRTYVSISLLESAVDSQYTTLQKVLEILSSNTRSTSM